VHETESVQRTVGLAEQAAEEYVFELALLPGGFPGEGQALNWEQEDFLNEDSLNKDTAYDEATR
jgi:hypothetical protein